MIFTFISSHPIFLGLKTNFMDRSCEMWCDVQRRVTQERNILQK